jgi:hypothetical protein
MALLVPGAPHARATSSTIVLAVYDAAGTKLSYAQVIDRITAGGAGWRGDATYRVSDGSIVEMPALYQLGGEPAFDVPETGVGLSLPWRTASTGYSTLFVDNGGGGFSTGGTVNLTYRAALDYRTKLDAAIARRPEFVATPAFTAADQDARDLLGRATAADDGSTRGALGQQALDALARAFELLLRVDGRERGAAGAPAWWGVTVDRTKGFRSVMGSIADMTVAAPGSGYVRVVFDEGVGPAAYDGIVAEARRDGVTVVGQILDSSAMRRLDLAAFERRVRAYVGHFPGIDVWEIGNEINGEWLGADAAAKASYAAAYVKAADPSDTTVLTLFWQMGTAGRPTSSMFQWARDNVDPAFAANLDVVAMSTWLGGAPLGISMDEVFTRLHAMFPAQRLAMGELGYWEPGTTRAWWWRSTSHPTTVVRRSLAVQMYQAALSFPSSVGGVFWWYYVQEMADRGSLWRHVRAAISSASP